MVGVVGAELHSVVDVMHACTTDLTGCAYIYVCVCVLTRYVCCVDLDLDLMDERAGERASKQAFRGSN